MSTDLVQRNDLSKPVGAEGELSVTDKRLLTMARQRMSPEEISETLGGLLTPVEAAQRIREILRSHDWMSQVEQRALILLDMQELKDILLLRVRQEEGFITNRAGRSSYVHGDPRWSATLVNLLKELNRSLESQSGVIDAERQKIRAAHASLMLRAIDSAFRILLKEIAEKHPTVLESDLAGMLERALPAAIATVDQATEEPL